MNGIFSEQEGLANVLKLQVLDPADDLLVAWGMDHDMSTKLISSRGLRVTPVDNVSRHKANFGSHFQHIITVLFSSRIMHVLESLVQSDCALETITCNGCNGWEFSMVHIVVSGRNHELVADLPIDLLNYCELVISWLDC